MVKVVLPDDLYYVALCVVCIAVCISEPFTESISQAKPEPVTLWWREVVCGQGWCGCDYPAEQHQLRLWLRGL